MKSGAVRFFILPIVFLVLLCCMKTSVLAEGRGKIITKSEKVYESMSLDSSVLENVIPGMRFDILSVEQDEEENSWCLVYTQAGTVGYIQEKSIEYIPYIEFVSDVQFVKSSERVNIRESYSTMSEVIGSLPKNREVKVLAICGNELGEIWYQIAYEDIVGFVRNSVMEVCENIQQDEEESEQQDNQEPVIEQTSENKIEKTDLAVTGQNEIEIKKADIDIIEENSAENADVKISPFGKMLIGGIIFGICLGLLLLIRVILITKNTGEKRKGK